ncbi:MAG: Hsp70 family protein, partial [Planctomycetales bacterium]|nr:Hsp70 family protein [Planctomycetales bacterium]
EEPQAAVYAWLAARGEDWRKELRAGDRLLVCDVGGGTTDLTLIEAVDHEGELQLNRLAVGNHLLVGGDNMDLALAHRVAGLFKEKGVALNAWQSVALWHSCRLAKEALLAPGGPDSHPVAILGRGSRVIGGTVSVDVPRSLVLELIVEGFFPSCGLHDRPQRRRASGFQEIGLPFEADAAITRHVAAFVSTQGQVHDAGNLDASCPTHLLFNGGVFKATALRDRLLATLRQWAVDLDPNHTVSELAGQRDLDFAVARGAAHYAWRKQRGGVRIRGGTARSYYIGIETAGLAIPGAPRPLKALCVAPFGMEEGTSAEVPHGEVGLVLGEPVHFRFFSSAVRPLDQPGALIDDVPDVPDDDVEPELVETDSLETTLASPDEGDDAYVPVRFESRITELGMLELWCVSTRTEDRWKLEFSVRES